MIDNVLTHPLSIFRVNPWENLPHVLRSGLCQLSARSGARLSLYGGYLRDAFLGLRARDLDILVCGEMASLKESLEAPERELPFDVLALEETRAGGLVVSVHLPEIGQHYRLDCINVLRFLLAQDTEPSPLHEKLVEQVLHATDFTVNACALAIPAHVDEVPNITVASPDWLKDLSSGIVRHLRPPISRREGLFLFKAVRLERLLMGTIAPFTEEVIRRLTASSAWRNLLSEGHHKHLLRMLKSQENTPQHLERLWELGILAPILPLPLPRLRVLELCELLFNSTALPSMGEEGKAPWVLAALLATQPQMAQEQFLKRLSHSERAQLVEMQSYLQRMSEDLA